MTALFDLVGLALPPFIDLINSKIEDSRIRLLVSLVFCSVIGVGIHFAVNGGLVGIDGVSKDILAVWGLAQLTYQGVYKGSDLQEKIR